MRRILDAIQAKEIDSLSIAKGMPSVVMMERAALAVAEETEKYIRDHKILKPNVLAVCKCGNNGADGVACARILVQHGINCDVHIVGNEEHATQEFVLQKSIALQEKVKFIHEEKFSSYNIIIDAMFGIGLSRNIEGANAEVIKKINDSGAFIISVDIPSGISASDGKVCGAAVRASLTVTFGYYKAGHIMYPGREYCHKTVVRDCGFLRTAEKELSGMLLYTIADEEFLPGVLPERRAYSNKGNYGKLLIVAGSKDITGAAFFSALASYRMGAGIVTVLTHECISDYLKSVVPEAIIRSYRDDNVRTAVAEEVKKATVIVVGPGLSTGDTSATVVDTIINEAKVPVIVDADALNIISENLKMIESISVPMVFTPHIGEMMRLTGLSKDMILDNLIGISKEFAQKYNIICVLKDAATVVNDGKRCYINSSGNSGMAKGGSGDVLTGIIAGVLAVEMAAKQQDKEILLFDAVCRSVWLHGMAGDAAAAKHGKNGMIARDIIDEIALMML